MIKKDRLKIHLPIVGHDFHAARSLFFIIGYFGIAAKHDDLIFQW